MVDKTHLHKVADKQASDEKKDSSHHFQKEVNDVRAGVQGSASAELKSAQKDIEKTFGSLSITGLVKSKDKSKDSTKASAQASGELSATAQMEGDHHTPAADKPVEKKVDSQEEISKRKTEIQNKYGVVFDTSADLPDNEKPRLREPSVAELDVLDTALNKSRESRQGTESSKPLHIAFFTYDKSDGASATHGGISGGGSRIIVRSENLTLADGDIKDKVTLGSVLMHELGHRSDFIDPRDNEQMGWKQIGDKSKGQFALEASDGRLYKYVEGKNSPTGECYWQKVTADGTVQDGLNDSRLSDSEMQKEAKVKQPMHPASAPAESFANAIRMYRQNPETRKELEEKSPEIYKYMEEYDRKHLRRIGTDFFGVPEYKREPSGLVSQNSRSWNPWMM